MQHRNRNAAFTLIELLVVIGLIGLLAAGIGVAMRDGNPTAGLRTAQSELVSLLSAARGQAALTQSDSMIVVDVTSPSNDSYLRELQIVVRAGAAPLNEWRPVGSPILLPQGVYVVPPDIDDIPNTQILASGWPALRMSKGFEGDAVVELEERDYDATLYPYRETGVFSGKKYVKFRTFSPLGRTSGDGAILVTSGRRSGAGSIALDNPENIRGVYVSKYGVATFLNEATAFDHLPAITP